LPKTIYDVNSVYALGEEAGEEVGAMEAAERLYGVTMHEKGISDVISIDVSEIEQKIGVTLH